MPKLPGATPARLTQAAAILLISASLAACSTTGTDPVQGSVAQAAPAVDPMYVQMYAAVDDGEYTIPAVDVSKIDPKFLRQVVDYTSPYPVGTIIVDPYNRFLYLTMEGGKAMRYGIGVAKAGLEFEGEADLARKASWPGWTPTQDMIKREPDRYGPYSDGLEGGLENPLGARALYLYQNGKDTLYRIHGTTEPWSIGQAVSSGCVRLFNQDIIDLHSRVQPGTRIVVLGPDGQDSGATGTQIAGIEGTL